MFFVLEETNYASMKGFYTIVAQEAEVKQMIDFSFFVPMVTFVEIMPF